LLRIEEKRQRTADTSYASESEGGKGVTEVLPYNKKQAFIEKNKRGGGEGAFRGS